jgi:hypothetical protein
MSFESPEVPDKEICYPRYPINPAITRKQVEVFGCLYVLRLDHVDTVPGYVTISILGPGLLGEHVKVSLRDEVDVVFDDGTRKTGDVGAASF